jgi:hypothetical protein
MRTRPQPLQRPITRFFKHFPRSGRLASALLLSLHAERRQLEVAEMRKAHQQDNKATSPHKERFSRTRPRSFFSAARNEDIPEEQSERTPERALMLAVLEDAVACYAGRLKAPRENPRILRRQAAFWLSCEDWDSPFSFNNVCEALALDPTALRERILSEDGLEG